MFLRYKSFHVYNENVVQILADARKEVEELKKSIERAEEIDKFRDEVVELEKELVWAVVSIIFNIQKFYKVTLFLNKWT